jgi:hypothetical protein
MSHAIKESLQHLRQAVFGTKSRIETIVSGQGIAEREPPLPKVETTTRNRISIGQRGDCHRKRQKKRYNF